MAKRSAHLIVLPIVLFVVAAASGGMTDVDSVVEQPRFWNDYPDSDLTITNNFPTQIQVVEQSFGDGGFANQHRFMYSTDGGATIYEHPANQAFEITLDVMLDVGSPAGPRKEVGMMIQVPSGPDGKFMIASDGEVAVFGGGMPFHGFGPDVYQLGDTATISVIYLPHTGSIEYRYQDSDDDLTSGRIFYDLPLFDPTTFGVVGQFQVDGANPSDFALVNFSNFTFDVPEPASLVLLAVAGLLIRRR